MSRQLVLLGIDVIREWFKGGVYLPPSISRCPKSTWCQRTYAQQTAPSIGQCSSHSCPFLGPFMQGPLWVLCGVIHGRKTPKLFTQVLGTYHAISKQNEHIKLTQTHEDTQAQSKAYLQNVMDVLGRLTPKNNKNSNSTYEN